MAVVIESRMLTVLCSSKVQKKLSFIAENCQSLISLTPSKKNVVTRFEKWKEEGSQEIHI